MSENSVGLLLVDKPSGLTSHDVVNRVRRSLSMRRVGHAGTLDPDATGLLVLCLGEATRLLEYLATGGKVYEGEITFGTVTDTDDASGTVVAQGDASGVDASQILASAKRLVGTYTQRVPRYSAVHVGGKRAYELARQGVIEDSDLPSREVTVARLDVLFVDHGDVVKARFRVWCSTGTYVRSLCRDWGELTGVGAHMSQLRRVKSGAFDVKDAVDLDAFLESDSPRQYVRPIEDAVVHLPILRLDGNSLKRLCQGQTIDVDPRTAGLTPFRAEPYQVLDADGKLYAIAELSDHGPVSAVRPKKVLRNFDSTSGDE